MVNYKHYIQKCREHDVVINQCRCPGDGYIIVDCYSDCRFYVEPKPVKIDLDSIT